MTGLVVASAALTRSGCCLANCSPSAASFFTSSKMPTRSSSTIVLLDAPLKREHPRLGDCSRPLTRAAASGQVRAGREACRIGAAAAKRDESDLPGMRVPPAGSPLNSAAMKQLMKDFKGFALSGNVLDLAIGVILGVAFNDVVQKFAQEVLLQLIGAIFGAPNFDNLSQLVNGAQIHYGRFITALVNFLLIAFSLLMIVKLLMRVGLNFRAQGNRECDFCKSFIPVDASRCMYCTSELTPSCPTDAARSPPSHPR
jgi:large conductance mechanosensitive channel